jgi:hypothetical protein
VCCPTGAHASRFLTDPVDRVRTLEPEVPVMDLERESLPWIPEDRDRFALARPRTNTVFIRLPVAGDDTASDDPEGSFADAARADGTGLLQISAIDALQPDEADGPGTDAAEPQAC